MELSTDNNYRQLLEQIGSTCIQKVRRCRTNLIYMRLLYQRYSISQKPSDLLSWSHYVELLKIDFAAGWAMNVHRMFVLPGFAWK